jgi:hypothetical protein
MVGERDHKPSKLGIRKDKTLFVKAIFVTSIWPPIRLAFIGFQWVCGVSL